MKYRIMYYSEVGYEEDGTPEVKMLTWTCQDEQELDYALNCINEEDIFSIREVE